MLLNYDIDTKDEDLTDKAIELRRRFARRKLEEDIASNAVNNDTLFDLREKSRAELKEQGHEQFAVAMANVSQTVAVRRLDQQMSIHKSLSELDRDLNRVSRMNKTRFDALSDLTTRIQQMRQELHKHTEKTVEQEMLESTNLMSRGNMDKELVCGVYDVATQDLEFAV